MRRANLLLSSLFAIAVLAHAAWAFHFYHVQAAWANVPPAPSQDGMTAFALGDRQFAYRVTGVMLQNLGNTGGRAIPLGDYDEKTLGRWFLLSNQMDPVSNFVPMLAAYYFSASQKPEKLGPLVDYLAVAGRQPGKEKWRWMAQAVYIARFRMNDLNRSLQLANELAAMWKPGRPGWMRQMPVFILKAQGDKQAAYDIMIQILKDDGAKMDAAEMNFMVSYICDNLLTPEAARDHPLCKVRKEKN